MGGEDIQRLALQKTRPGKAKFRFIGAISAGPDAAFPPA